MPVESTMDYLGYALSTSGTPLVDRVVTLKVADTLATLGSTVTDANGRWKFDDISPAQIVRAEISAGTTPQIAVKSVFSGDAYSLYIREKLTAAPAAIFNLPPVANIYANGVPLATALGPDLDSRFVNVTGDAIGGTLVVGGTSGPVGELTVKGQASGNVDLHLLEGDTNNGWNLGVVVADDSLRIMRFVYPSTYAEWLTISTAGAVGLPGTLAVTGATSLAATTLSAPLTLPTGSGAAPSLTFTGDSNTGIYRIGPDTVGVAVGGALVLNLGINTATVTGDVTVNGMVHVTNALVAQGIFTHDGSALGFYGAGGYPKQTVSGPKGGNAALTSLCAALATLGLITNSTT